MNLDYVIDRPFPAVAQTYTTRDSLLYALSLGLGADPTDPRQLRYVFERDQIAMPSMAVVLGHPGPWLTEPAVGIDYRKIVYAEQSLEMHSVLLPQGSIKAYERVIGVFDKGRDKGTLLRTERRIVDQRSERPLATLRATLMCRGDGGNGAAYGEAGVPREMPASAPDRVAEMPTLPQSALLYRLNGDMNPLHADPELARNLGFQRPILHGLCTFGVAMQAVLALWCDCSAQRLVKFGARFTSVVYPGETVVVETWREGSEISFRASVKERGVKVLDYGHAELRD